MLEMTRLSVCAHTGTFTVLHIFSNNKHTFCIVHAHDNSLGAKNNTQSRSRSLTVRVKVIPIVFHSTNCDM